MPLARSAIKKALTSKGFRLEQGNRDHDVFVLYHGGRKQAIFTKVSRGTNYKTLGDPLVARMSNQLRLSRRDFDDLVACPLNAAGYIGKLVEQGIITR